jgi:hypothetical protein
MTDDQPEKKVYQDEYGEVVCIKDPESGQFLPGSGRNLTSEQASAMAKQRHSKEKIQGDKVRQILRDRGHDPEKCDADIVELVERFVSEGDIRAFREFDAIAPRPYLLEKQQAIEKAKPGERCQACGQVVEPLSIQEMTERLELLREIKAEQQELGIIGDRPAQRSYLQKRGII